MAHFRLSTLYRQTGRTADAQRELEQYQKYNEMKEKLRQLYRTIRVEPAKKEPDDTGGTQKAVHRAPERDRAPHLTQLLSGVPHGHALLILARTANFRFTGFI